MNRKTLIKDLENEVMEKLLGGDDIILDILRNQYRKAVVEKREFTGTGFYTTFNIREDVPILEQKNSLHLGDVIGQIKGVNEGVGFVLFVKDGVIDFLEGYTYGDEKWPEDIIDYTLSYISGDTRDMEKLKIKWK